MDIITKTTESHSKSQIHVPKKSIQVEERKDIHIPYTEINNGGYQYSVVYVEMRTKTFVKILQKYHINEVLKITSLHV